MSDGVLPTEPSAKDGAFHLTETASTAFPMDGASPPTSADALGIVGMASAQGDSGTDDQSSPTARATRLLQQAEVRAEHQAQARATMLDLASALDESNARRHHLATLLNQEQRNSSDLKRQVGAIQRRLDAMESAEEERQAKILLDKALKSGNTMVFGMLLQKSREAYGTNYFGPGKGDDAAPPAIGAGAGFSLGNSSGGGGGAGGAAAAGGRTIEGTARGYGARGEGPRGSEVGSGRVEGGAAGGARGTEAEGGGVRESAVGARESTGGARESAGGARESTGEARESPGGALESISGGPESAGGAREGTGEARESPGGAREGTGEAREGTGEAREGTGEARESTGEAREGTGGARESTREASEAADSGTGGGIRGSAAGESEAAGSGAGGLQDEASGAGGSRAGQSGAVGSRAAGSDFGVDASATGAEDTVPGGAQLTREAPASRPISRGSKASSFGDELHEAPPERSISKSAERRGTGWDFVVNKGDVGDKVTITLTVKLWKNVVDKAKEARAAELAELERLRLEEERKRQIEEEKRKAVDAIKRIAQALEERLNAAQETIRQHEKRQADLEKELQAARDLLAERESQHEERVQQIQAELDLTRQELASMKGQLSDLQNQYEGALENLRNADKQFADERRQLKDTIRNITSELAEAMVLAKHMRETALKAKREAAGSVSPAKFAELIGQLEEMKNQLSALWKDFMRENDTNDALRRNLDKNKRQLELERQFLPLLHKVRGPLGPKKGADPTSDGAKKKDNTMVPSGMPPIDGQTKMRMSKSTGALGGPLGGPLGGGRPPGGYEAQDITRLQLASTSGLSAVPTLS